MRHEQTSIIEAIKLDKARLARLDEERRVISERLQHLHAQLATLEEVVTPSGKSSYLSPVEKISLFPLALQRKGRCIPQTLDQQER